MRINLTDREADVMQVLWDHGPSVVSDVRIRLSDKLAYITVLTVLRTLEAKGYVEHEEEGRRSAIYRIPTRRGIRVRRLRGPSRGWYLAVGDFCGLKRTHRRRGERPFLAGMLFVSLREVFSLYDWRKPPRWRRSGQAAPFATHRRAL